MPLQKTTLEALYREVGPLIYARCCRMLNDRAAAEDATQDVFIKLIRHGQLPEGESRLAWVQRVAVNHCLNVMRDQSRRARPTPDEELSQQASSDDPEAAVLEADFSRRALARVPEALKVPATLFHAEGMDQLSIAKRLGVSRRTVLYRLSEFNQRMHRFVAAHAA